ncbi:hypothetical protein D9M68_923370 [compost metagenome]
MRVGIEHSQRDDVVRVGQHLQRFGLIAHSGLEVGNGLGRDVEVDARATSFVQQLDHLVVQYLGSLVDKDVDRLRHPMVVNLACSRGEVGQRQRSDGGADHWVRE